MVPLEIKRKESLNTFENTIVTWNRTSYPCRLCNYYIANIGFIWYRSCSRSKICQYTFHYLAVFSANKSVSYFINSLVHFKACILPCRFCHLCKYFISHNFFCAYQSLISLLFMLVTAIKETWHFNPLMPNNHLADSRFLMRFKIIDCKIFVVCLIKFGPQALQG